MHFTDLHLDPNEASDLTPVLEDEREVLLGLGFDEALVTVLDEAPAEECVGLLLHESGAPPESGWSSRRVKVKARPKGEKGETEDAEACAERDGFLYVFGSQFGSKDGPLQRKRQWAARVSEAELLDWVGGGSKPKMRIANFEFGLHRAVNDALQRSGVDLLPLGPASRAVYIDATIRKAARKGKPWDGVITSADHPINVEASSFRDDGTLLLGLRHPCTATGDAILVELEDVDRLFEDDAPAPHCRNVWVLDGSGSPEAPVGLRALHATGGDRFHAVVGNLDSTGKGAHVLEDHPQGAVAPSTHVAFELPLTAGGGPVRCETVRVMEDLHRVEGLVVTDGRARYVLDRDGRIELGTLAVG